MATLQDLPAMAAEFIELAKTYLRQETVEQGKKLGRFAGFSFGAAALWALAVILLGVAGLRGLVALLPEGPYWEALAYFIVVLVGGALIGILVRLGPKSEPKEAPAMTGGPQ
ncbi:MAG: phage holin family protein [Acidimicrobiia bacterium]